MTFGCNECHKTVRTIADVRNCSRCQSNGRAANVPAQHNDSDWITPALIGYALGGGFSSHPHESPSAAPFDGAGGASGGAGASGSWNDASPSSDSGSSYSSSDSSSSSSDSSASGSDSCSSSGSSAD